MGGVDQTGARAARLGFIGLGKAGGALSSYFGRMFPVDGIRGRAECTDGSLASLVAESDAVFVTTPDGAIADVWSKIRGLAEQGGGREDDAGGLADCDGAGGLAESGGAGGRGLRLDGKVFVHCSGHMTSEVFAGAEALGASRGSMHPIFAFGDAAAFEKWKGEVCFTLEGDAGFMEYAEPLLDALGNRHARIAAEAKPLYHVASVFFSNFVCGVADTGSDLLRGCGLPEDFSAGAWRALFLANAESVGMEGPAPVLTGPVERADAGTVAQHLARLAELPDGAALGAYRALSRALVGTARKKHPDRDYSAVEAALGAKTQGDGG